MNRVERTRVRFPLLPMFLVVMAGISIGSAGADMVLQDGTFADSDWDQVHFWMEGNGGYVESYQAPSGGNPGDFRVITVTLNPEGLRNNRANAFFGYRPVTYDPTQHGPIVSMSYYEDSRLIQGHGQGQGAAPALMQNGNIYIGPLFAIPNPTWAPNQFYGLTAASFYRPESPSEHPDFSPTGGPITFGFLRGNSGTSDDPYVSIAGIDNWSVAIYNSPVPVMETTWGRIKLLSR